MAKSSYSKTLSIGFTLFSMFFGAGNLIFAPYMGAEAAGNAPWALLGFLCTAVCLPIGAIVIISRYKDGSSMIATISKKLAVVFITLIYLLIGPCIAIPRTASTSYSMLAWLIGNGNTARVLFVIVFFFLCALTAWKPGKLKDILGKIMAPILIALIVILCLDGLFFQQGDMAASAINGYENNAFALGFTEGYQTMDILAAFCFGSVIFLNIQQAGFSTLKEEKHVLAQAAVIAGVCLACLYALLAFCGMKFSGVFASLNNGAEVLSALASLCFGQAGTWIVSLIFLIACYNVCSGLLCCCAQYFEGLFPKVSYVGWLAIFTVFGALVAVLGLDAILAMSAPVLSWICPIAIAFLAYGLIRWMIQNRKKANAV